MEVLTSKRGCFKVIKGLFFRRTNMDNNANDDMSWIDGIASNKPLLSKLITVFSFLVLMISGCTSANVNTLYVRWPNGVLMPVKIQKARVSPDSIYAQHSLSMAFKSYAGGKNADSLPIESLAITPINPKRPLSWFFTGGTVQFIPNEPIEVYYVEYQRKLIFIGMRKGWDDGVEFEYVNKLNCPGKLVIDYLNGDWTEVETTDSAELSISDSRIKIAGDINLKTAKSYLKHDDLELEKKFLIRKDDQYSINNCLKSDIKSYELDFIDKYYVIKIPIESETGTVVMSMGVMNLNGSYPIFCSMNERL
jgi:hypothetical protein